MLRYSAEASRSSQRNPYTRIGREHEPTAAFLDQAYLADAFGKGEVAGRMPPGFTNAAISALKAGAKASIAVERAAGSVGEVVVGSLSSFDYPSAI